MSTRATHLGFWKENPALLYGLCLLIGLSQSSFLVLWTLYLLFLKFFKPLFFLCLSLLYGHVVFLDSPLDISQIKKVRFCPKSLKPYSSHFYKSLLYQGTFYADQIKKEGRIYHPIHKLRPKANCDYVIEGSLKQISPYEYVIKAKTWTQIDHTFRLAEFRFQAKEWMRSFLQKNIRDAKVVSFLSAIITADVEDRILRYEFGKLGLQHILAISGFHFALLVSFCSSFLSLFVRSKAKICTLLLLLHAYFLFVGSLPSVQRSYLTASLFFFAKLLKRPSTATNLLGASLFVELLFHPQSMLNLGFQLSFLSCFGILLFQPLFAPFFSKLFPSKKGQSLSFFEEMEYFLAQFLKGALTLSLSINAAILPLLFHHFHTFPLLSLLYNLFFPALVSLTLFSLLFSCAIYLIFPPLSSFFFYFTEGLAKQLLTLSSYPPLFLEVFIRIKEFPAAFIPFYLFSLFCISLLTRSSQIRYNQALSQWRP